MPPVLALHAITKRFGSLVANDAISLELHAGEVLALLGENGAGKSTLMAILFGHQRADAGRIEAFGAPLPPGQPKAALAAGIGMVHQHFALAEALSVLDNVMLGTEPLWQLRSRRAAARKHLDATARRFGLHVDADARVRDLSVGERQRVEIVKALVRGARVLILDEPTAVLTPAESASLFETLRQLVAEGLSVVFISHKLDEVLRVSQRIAVLRAGKLVATLPAAGASKAALAELMVGRQVERPVRRARPVGALRCRLRGVSTAAAGAAVRLDGVDLDLHAGEITAIAGVSGNGQQALAELLFGLRAPSAGRLEVDGRVLPARPRSWVEAGVARIPEDRHAVGAVGDMAVWENAVLERHAAPTFARAGVMKRGRCKAHAQALIARFDVRGTASAGLSTTARVLSGGNLQKLILGRSLMGDPAGPGGAPPLIVADQPTWGLDVGAVAYVHQQLLDACADGAAVLLISEDLDEVFALADRIAVIHLGRLVPARPSADWTLAAIGLAMTGEQADAPADAHADAPAGEHAAAPPGGQAADPTVPPAHAH